MSAVSGAERGCFFQQGRIAHSHSSEGHHKRRARHSPPQSQKTLRYFYDDRITVSILLSRICLSCCTQSNNPWLPSGRRTCARHAGNMATTIANAYAQITILIFSLTRTMGFCVGGSTTRNPLDSPYNHVTMISVYYDFESVRIL